MHWPQNPMCSTLKVPTDLCGKRPVACDRGSKFRAAERETAVAAHAPEHGGRRWLVHTQCSLRAWLGQPSVVKLKPPRGPERARQSSCPIGPGRQELSGLDRSTGAGHAFWACLAMPGHDASAALARDGPQSKILGLVALPGDRSSTASLWLSLAASPRKAPCDGPHGRHQTGRETPRHAHSGGAPDLKPPPADFCGGTWVSTNGGRFGHSAGVSRPYSLSPCCISM